SVNRVRCLGRREDPLAPGKQDGRGEHVVLKVCLGADEPVADKLRDQRGDPVVAEPAGVDWGGDKIVPERVHRYERGELACIAEVVREQATREGRAGCGLAGEDVDLAPGNLLAQERERKAGEV